MRFSWLAVLILAIAPFSLQAGEPEKDDVKKAEARKVACVGDSITAGSYPGHLQKMLDTTADKYVVKNYGVSGATMLMKSERPYTKQKAYENALKFEPDFVVLMLGTNDTRKKGPNTYELIGDFVPDGKKIVEALPGARMSSKPKILLCIPVPIYGEGNFGLNSPTRTSSPASTRPQEDRGRDERDARRHERAAFAARRLVRRPRPSERRRGQDGRRHRVPGHHRTRAAGAAHADAGEEVIRGTLECVRLDTAFFLFDDR